MSGLDILLLTTSGRNSGKSRTVPLGYRKDGNRFVLIGSMGGAPTHPGWYLNLVANPEASIRIGRETIGVRARTAEGEERERLWRVMVNTFPGYDKYREKTSREIPVVVLEPA